SSLPASGGSSSPTRTTPRSPQASARAVTAPSLLAPATAASPSPTCPASDPSPSTCPSSLDPMSRPSGSTQPTAPPPPSPDHHSLHSALEASNPLPTTRRASATGSSSCRQLPDDLGPATNETRHRGNDSGSGHGLDAVR